MAPGPSPTFLARTIRGREDAMVRLEGLLAGGGALALVGEAGIGKTRLARWTAERASAARTTVTEGAAVLGLAEPLGVFRDLVRSARRAGVEPPLRDPLAAGFPAQVLPELGGAGIDPGNLGATFEAAVRYFGALAGARVALVILEDLHWADATSLSLAAFLARTLRGGAVSLLLTFRPEDHTGSPALKGLRAELRRGRMAEEVPLGPLDARDATAMLAEVLDGRPAPDVTTELLRLSGGNPFALEELARAVVDSGWLDPTTGRRRGTGAVELPWTLAESIRARAALLPPAERDIAEWAAVIGARFDARLLERASGLDRETVLDGLDALVAAGLVVEAVEDPSGDAFAFRHAIVHEALSQKGLVARRRERHAAVLTAAEALTGEGVLTPSPAELTGHAVAAGDRGRALVHSRRAVVEAQELGAVEEAVRHLERALSLWSDADGPALRAELLFAAGRLRARLARGDERAVALLQSARDAYLAIGDENSSLWCLAVLADARYETGDRLAALAEWEEAIPRLRRAQHSEALRTALVGYARGLALEERVAAGRVAADEGLAMVPTATNSSEASERVQLLITRGMVALWEYQPQTARPLLDEAVSLALAHHDDVGAARAHHIRAEAAVPFEPIPTLLGFARTARELVGRHGLRSLEAWYCVVAGSLLVEAGDWAEATRSSDEVEDLLDDSARAEWTRWRRDLNRATVEFGLGELEEAGGRAEALAEEPFALSSPSFRRMALVLTGEVRLLLGDAEGALACVGPSIQEMERAIREERALDETAMPSIATILTLAGSVSRTDELAAALTRRGAAADDAVRALLRAGDEPDEALAAIATATAALDAQGRRFRAAQMHVLGAILASAHPAGRLAATRLARGALDRYRAMGSDVWCRRLEGMLRSWGERAPTRAGPGEGGLSGRELEVLGLVAEGLTNRQIAERLVISEHTAIRHVANLMGKLGASSRAAAVRLAGERGLLAESAGGEMARSAGVE